MKGKAVYFYQPFQQTIRRVAIESEELTEYPTLVNTKENGRLLITGGNDVYYTSNKVYQVDMCMNTLEEHSTMNVGRLGHAAVYINNKDIYVIGGYNSQADYWLRSVEVCYDAFGGIGGAVDEAKVREE